MRLLSYVASLLLLTSSVGASDSASQFEDVILSAIGNGGLRVDYRSTGCFHELRFELSFRHSKDGSVVVAVTEILKNNLEKEDDVTAKRVSLGETELLERDLVRFLRLLKYYEEPPKGQSTDIEHVVFSKASADTLLVIVEYTDSSGGAFYRLDVLSFAEIIERVRVANRKRA